MTVLPRLGLGMAALGRPGYINLDRSSILGTPTATNPNVRDVQTMQDRANTVMDQVLIESAKLNIIPWFDCARSYGLSEKFVGEFLQQRNVKPNEVYVSSKWGYTYVADWKVELEEGEPHEVKDHSVENFLKQIHETKEYMGEYVNLYQVHSATFDSGILTDKRVHEALNQCREENGWSIGLSVSGPCQDEILNEAMKITTATGKKLFDSVQCTFNILEQRPGTALMKAHEAGMDIIIKEGLANGRALRHPALLGYSKKMGCEADQLALGCILAQPFEPRVLSGAVTPEQLTSNFKALEISENLKKKGSGQVPLEEVMESCVMTSDEYWKERSALAWN